MKYEKQIINSFNLLGFEPREKQISIVNEILESFLDQGMQNVILSAPTGSGKSIIGAVTAETITTIINNESCAKSSILLTATNALSDQYFTSFESSAAANKFLMIKGANNFECANLSTPDKPETADSCFYGAMITKKEKFNKELQKCEGCEYNKLRRLKNKTRHMVTNYSYFFIDRLFAHHLEDRDLIVWDEVHLINDLFSEHNAVVFSSASLKKFTNDMTSVINKPNIKIGKMIKSLIKNCENGWINENNYLENLENLQTVYAWAKGEAELCLDNAIQLGNPSEITKVQKFFKHTADRLCKVSDLLKLTYDHVFDFNQDEMKVSIKPIFINDSFETLQASKRNLLMSATISDTFLFQTMMMDEKKTKFIKLPPEFDPQNKKVVFYKTQQLSYKTMSDPAVLKNLVTSVNEIANHHSKKNERGLILAPSFLVTEMISRELRNKNFTVIEHVKGEKLVDALEKFKKFKGQCVFVTPSAYEGIDLPGDICRWQVIVKAPYPSLGEKRMKHIADMYGNVYKMMTLLKIIQGAGRSVRGRDDWATTYILDKNASWLFEDKKLNVWKDEFDVRFSSMLE